MNRKRWTKAALAFSFVLFILWWTLGTSATLAWFSDADTVRNEFKVGLLNLDVSYRDVTDTGYTSLQGASEVFNDEALYEPGYTQVVILKIENKGDVEFDYKLAVTVADYDEKNQAVNAWGQEIYLPNYLKYGVVFAKDEAQLLQKVKDRLEAREHATNQWGVLDTWSEPSPYTFGIGEDPHYAALIVYMPEEVDNVANYRGALQPRVELGIKVFAQQSGTMEK